MKLIEQLHLGGGQMMLGNIVTMEAERGFTVIRPGDVVWLPRTRWKNSTIVSLDGERVRLVLLEALRQNEGAFTRLVHDIIAHKLIPVLVEPHPRLEEKLIEWGWRCRRRRSETLWYPRHAH